MIKNEQIPENNQVKVSKPKLKKNNNKKMPYCPKFMKNITAKNYEMSQKCNNT